MFIEIPGFPNYLINELGDIISLFPGRGKLKPDVTNCGYLRVSLWNGSVRRYRQSVHRLVMLSWVGPSALPVNHINGIKSDNRLENLEYCTHGDNQRHALATGLKKSGESSPVAVLSDLQMLELYNLKGTMFAYEAAKVYGVSKSLVSLVWLGQGRMKAILKKQGN